MNSDIRLQVGLFENVKIKKLHKRLGAEAVLSLLKLWIYVAVNNPNGVLDNFNEEDIDIICCWEHADSILPVFIKLVLLEKTDTGFIVHDWEENNPWAANADKRSEQARRAASARWDKKQAKTTGVKTIKNQTLNADSMLTAMPLTFPSLTFPSLTLNNSKTKNRFIIPKISEIKKYCDSRSNDVDAEAFHDFYESKGWLVGKNKMKDWKAAVRTWERNGIKIKDEPNSPRLPEVK